MKPAIVAGPLALGGLSLGGLAWRAFAAADLVAFPERYKEGVHYATIKRGDTIEELFTSRS